MRRRRPCFHLIAGPNGAGKTTFARRFLPHYAGSYSFLNADLIAAGLSPLRPEAAAISAGRILVREWRRLARARIDFAAESTLAGVGLIRRLKSLRRAGYRLCLYFLWLPAAALAQARVQARVLMGGHDVPPETIARRYLAGLDALREGLLDRFDDWYLFDNSGPRPRLIASERNGRRHVTGRKIFETLIRADSAGEISE